MKRTRRTFKLERLESRDVPSAITAIRTNPPPGLVGNTNASQVGIDSASATGNGAVVSQQAQDGTRSTIVQGLNGHT